MEILYYCKHFQNSNDFLCLLMFFQGYELLQWYFFVMSDMIYSVYCMLRFLFLLFFS